MKTEPNPDAPLPELLVLPDGTILAHHLTPELAAVLAALNPQEAAMRERAAAGAAPAATKNPTPDPL